MAKPGHSIESALAEGAGILKAAGIGSAALDARVLLSSVLNKDSLMLAPGGKIAHAAYEKFMALVSRRAGHEPVAYITGTKEFWKYSFRVCPETLIPRPDSETLVEAALAECARPQNILDLGTGTGCLLLSLLGEYPEARGLGMDSSRAAAALARSNARALGFAKRARFINKSWRDSAGPKDKFDLIISNPPYIKKGPRLSRDVAGYEPGEALFGGTDGLECYREIAAALRRWDVLAPGAKIFLEIGKGQGASVKKIFTDAGFRFLKSFRDLAGIVRVLEFPANNRPNR
jgi:release factor glutamine methyltransferase